jgi:hypothetical protein
MEHEIRPLSKLELLYLLHCVERLVLCSLTTLVISADCIVTL